MFLVDVSIGFCLNNPNSFTSSSPHIFFATKQLCGHIRMDSCPSNSRGSISCGRKTLEWQHVYTDIATFNQCQNACISCAFFSHLLKCQGLAARSRRTHHEQERKKLLGLPLSSWPTNEFEPRGQSRVFLA